MDLQNFFYHYKYHVIIGLMLIILAASFIYTIIDNQIEKAREANQPSADLDIMIFGSYETEDFSSLENKIKQRFPKWERVNVEFVYAPHAPESQLDIAAMQKSQAIIHVSKPDIYIFDPHHFYKFVESGPFLKLDPDQNEWVSERLQFYQKEDDEQGHAYGLDITGYELFDGYEIEGEEKIAVIRTDAENKENALRFLREMNKSERAKQ